MQGGDDLTGQKTDPPPCQASLPDKNAESVVLPVWGPCPEEVAGENSPPPSELAATRQTSNNGEKFNSYQLIDNNNVTNNEASSQNISKKENFENDNNPSAEPIVDPSLQSMSKLENLQSNDQFNNLNGNIPLQNNIDQFPSQSFPIRQGSQNSRNSQIWNQQFHFNQQNFLYQQQQQNQQINGPTPGFIPGCQSNFSTSFYPGQGGPPPLPGGYLGCPPPGYPATPRPTLYEQTGDLREGAGQFSLRARRRVRQRVDAGEPRNSYSSIPGFSFRQQGMLGRPELPVQGYCRGGWGVRGRGRGQGPLPLPPPPVPRYRQPAQLHHSHPPFPIATAAAIHRAALFLGQGGAAGRWPPGRAAQLPATGDDTKTVEGLLRDETSTKLDVAPPLTTPPSTPPLVDSENIKVKISSECISDPSHVSTASENKIQKSPEKAQNRNTNISENALLIREYLSTKLAAVTDMMEQGLGLVAQHSGPRDFSQQHLPINNNEFKENHAAQIMSHLLKVRQEMALNMSKDSDSDRQTESPGHSDNDIIEEDKDEPINLHQNGRSSAAGSGSDGETSPASPSSDAGNSTSSAKEQKVSRLENIVGGLARSTSSPLPPQGCKKRKLYQPVQHDVKEEGKGTDIQEEPDQKRMKDGLENHIKSMQDQFQKMQQKFQNDENADPENTDLQIDLNQEERKLQKEEITIEKRINAKSFNAFGHPLLNGTAEPLPLPPSTLNPNYMDLAKKFLQEQQDKVTKELITRDIVDIYVGKNDGIAEKLAAISPELDGLADILKSEIKTSLTIIVDSNVQRFLQLKRQPLGKFSENSPFNQDAKHKTPSGRAPQVRDRSTPRSIANPLSMANPLSLSNPLVTSNNLIMTGSAAPPRISFPTSACSAELLPKPPMMSLYPSSTNGHLSEEEREEESEQDDALNLVVTPKKKRHKVTDTRITPRTVSRLLAEQPSMAELQKHFGPGSPFMPPGFHMPKLLADLPRPPFHPSFLPNIPTSLNPGLPHPDHFPFSPFGFPGPLNRPRDLSPPRESRPRSASPPRDTRPPPPLLHPAILAAQAPDFHHIRHHAAEEGRPASETSSDDLKFEKMDFGNSPFSLGNMSGELNLYE